MANDVNSMLAAAKGTLAHAEKSFPSSGAPSSGAPKSATPAAKPAATAKPAPSLGDELKAKAANVDTYVRVIGLPKMHNGGPVATDGAYNLKAGEHVLTAPEAAMARKHAMMAVGMKSLAKPAGGSPTKTDAALKKPEKKSTSSMTIRPEKNQGAKIADKTKK